jgi:polysaccharide export outer membrane protein
MILTTINWKAFLKSTSRSFWLAFVGIVAALGLAGCASSEPSYKDMLKISNDKPVQPEAIILREGDVVGISFPANPGLKSDVQQIRRDGKITLGRIGEIDAAGKTVKTLQEELLKKYNEEMSVQEVTVSVQSSTFPIYVTGAVLRPGKILSDRPLTALDAIMEAGGPDYTRANLKAVKIIRNVNGMMEHYKLNLDAVLKGEDSQTFYLKPYDIIYVPERFSWL